MDIRKSDLVFGNADTYSLSNDPVVASEYWRLPERDPVTDARRTMIFEMYQPDSLVRLRDCFLELQMRIDAAYGVGLRNQHKALNVAQGWGIFERVRVFINDTVVSECDVDNLLYQSIMNRTAFGKGYDLDAAEIYPPTESAFQLMDYTQPRHNDRQYVYTTTVATANNTTTNIAGNDFPLTAGFFGGMRLVFLNGVKAGRSAAITLCDAAGLLTHADTGAVTPAGVTVAIIPDRAGTILTVTGGLTANTAFACVTQGLEARDDYYNDDYSITVLSGLGAGITKVVADYTGATRIFTVAAGGGNYAVGDIIALHSNVKSGREEDNHNNPIITKRLTKWQPGRMVRVILPFALSNLGILGYNRIVKGINFRIECTLPTNQNDILMVHKSAARTDAVVDHTMTFDKAYMWARRLYPTAGQELERLKSEAATFDIRYLAPHIVPVSRVSHPSHTIFLGHYSAMIKPVALLVAFQLSGRRNALGADPTVTDPCGLTKLYAEMNGRSFPQEHLECQFARHSTKSISGASSVDVTNESYLRAYMMWADMMANFTHTDAGPLMSIEEWAKSPIFALNLLSSDQSQFVSTGSSLQVNLHYELNPAPPIYDVKVVVLMDNTLHFEVEKGLGLVRLNP